MNSARLIPVAAAAMMLTAPLAADAQAIFPGTPQAVMQVAQSYGPVSLGQPDNEGRPFIEGETDGLLYNVLMYGCDPSQVCEAVQFYATFEPSTETPPNVLSQWNQDRLYGTAYTFDDGTIVVSYVINIDFGVTQTNFADSFDIFSILLSDFADRVYPSRVSSAPSK